MTQQIFTIFNFSKKTDTTNWIVVNDDVMGGKSLGKFYMNELNNAVFKGNVSLENNGGFSSLQYKFDAISTAQYSKIVLRIRGDGKSYQFRIKSKLSDRHSYISSFKSPLNWEIIEIHLNNMYPAFRGRKLKITNYNDNTIEQIGFLIGNKKAENFKLEIDTIVLR